MLGVTVSGCILKFVAAIGLMLPRRKTCDVLLCHAQAFNAFGGISFNTDLA